MLCNGFFHKCWRHDPSCKQCKKQRPTSSLCHDLKWGSRGSEIHSNNHLSKKRKKNIWDSLRRRKKWLKDKYGALAVSLFFFFFFRHSSCNGNVTKGTLREELSQQRHTIWVNVTHVGKSKAWLPLYARLQSLCKVCGFASWQNQPGPGPSLANQWNEQVTNILQLLRSATPPTFAWSHVVTSNSKKKTGRRGTGTLKPGYPPCNIIYSLSLFKAFC